MSTPVKEAAERITKWDIDYDFAIHLTTNEITDLIRVVKAAFPNGEHDQWAEDLIDTHMEAEEENGEPVSREDYDI